MVKKAQIRFIVTVMAILLIVFSVIFGITYNMRYSDKNKSISSALSDIERRYTVRFLKDDELVVKIVQSGAGVYTYTVENGKAVYDKAKIEELVDSATKNELSTGSVGNIYYSISKLNADNIPTFRLTACDMSDIIAEFNSTVLKTLIALIIIYAVMILIVVALSFRVFAPIKENLNKQKAFISDASHELKTPITVISANADVLSSIQKNKYTDSIKSQTQRLNVLVSDMLTLTRLNEENKNKIREDFSISDEINESVLPFDAVCFENGKTLITDIPENVHYTGDRQSLKKILDILMDNAVKYSSKNGTVKVSLKKERNYLVLSVFNTGSEIKDIDANKIFERFYRGDDSRSRESGGSGLGLSIAKSIADSNKWKISAVSRYGVSMCITVVL